ncbi:MAG: sugar phosphate nucleotidyltransferase, partial [Haloarculaceae archaeon]
TTVIDRVLSDLEADERIETVYVSTNERFATDFETHLAETDFEKPRLSIEETVEEDEKFGVVGALAQLVDREGIADEDLLVIAGDNLFSFDTSDFLDYFERRGEPTLAAYDVGSLERATAYGVLNVDGERVTKLEEKPDDPQSTLVSVACYAFPAESVQFDTYLAGDNNPDEPGWFIQWLVDREQVAAYSFEGQWFDIGTPESYLETVAWYLDGENLVAESATLKNADLGENVQVLGDVEVVDSSLDNSVVFHGTTVEDCEVRESIIDRDTRVQDLDLSGAVIGAHTQIPNGVGE